MAENKKFDGKGTLQLTAQDYIDFMFDLKGKIKQLSDDVKDIKEFLPGDGKEKTVTSSTGDFKTGNPMIDGLIDNVIGDVQSALASGNK